MSRTAARDQTFTDLVRQVADPLFRTALLLSGDWQQAEDLVQTSLAKLYGHGRWESLDHPQAYLRQMVVNEHISRRRRRASGELSMAVPPESARSRWEDPDPSVRVDLFRALATLTALDRAVVVLRYWDDLSVAETATSLGLTESAVRSRCLRVLTRLRSLLTTPLPTDQELDHEHSFDPDDAPDAFLTERMDRSLRGLELDPDTLAAGAIGRGRPIRRRRHALSAVAGLAAFGLLGGAAYAWNGPGAAPDQAVVQPADRPTAIPTATATSNPSPTASATPAARPLPARVVALRLERGLERDLTDFTGQGDGEEGLYVGATGAEDERIGASLNIQPDFDSLSIYSCPSSSDCDVTKGKDGSIRLVQRSREGRYVRITADLLDADGTRTVLTVAHPADGADGISVDGVAEAATRLSDGVSRAPSAAEVAEAEEQIRPWDYLSDEASSAPPTAEAGSVDHQVTARLAALYLRRLAPGTESGEYRGFQAGGTAGAVIMISRDQPELPGKAALRVVVTADAEMPGCDDPALDSCETSTPRAGAEMRQAVRTRVNMGEETDVITVDVRTPDGSLVTVTGGNTARFEAGHPRAGTSLAEVTEIALDPVWDVEAEPEPADVKAADRLDPWTWMSGPDDI